MEPFNPTHRLVGIIVALLVIGGVGGVTFVSERSNTSAFIPITTAQVLLPSPIVTSKTTYVLKCSGDDDDQKCVNIPVSTTPTPVTPAPTVSTLPPATVPKQTASVYKDGTYSATGSYMSPGGEDQIMVTLTLTNDVITSVSVTPAAGDRTSERYQNYFISGYKQYVIGYNIASVNLTYVSGSSLTPIGFDDALSQIEAQAKA